MTEKTKSEWIRDMYKSLISNFDKPTKKDKAFMLKEAKYEFELLCSGSLAGYEDYIYRNGKVKKELSK